MTRQEIYNKIFKLLEKKQFHVQNRFEFGEIDLETFEELSSARYNEYQEYVKHFKKCFKTPIHARKRVKAIKLLARVKTCKETSLDAKNGYMTLNTCV